MSASAGNAARVRMLREIARPGTMSESAVRNRPIRKPQRVDLLFLIREFRRDLLVEVDAEAGLLGERRIPALDPKEAAIKKILPKWILAAADLEQRAVGRAGANVERGQGADFALRIVRRHIDAESLGERGDLAHLRNAADMNDVRH